MPSADSTLDLPSLIRALQQTAAYPHPVDVVEVHQTHISVVFLAGPFAYKIKKPVRLGFLDFSTLELRKHFCEEEVRLNRRLAAPVYLGVVPITARDAQTMQIGGNGPVVEWAVQMRRLPSDATLESRLEQDAVGLEEIDALADRLVAFHQHADTRADISAFGRFEVVANNARDNFVQTESMQGITVHPAVFERLRHLTESDLTRHREMIDKRAQENVPRDTHGDLHLDHIYLFPDEAPPNDLWIIDCIEFADRFRYADPVADMAFVAMDLAYHGRRDLAQRFVDCYFRASGDAEGGSLLPFYAAYRAIVRAKVEGMKQGEPEIDAAEREQATQRARAHWLLALGEMAPPSQRPCLLLLAGLPGSGKSTLARGLPPCAILQSDVIRKELAGAASAQATEFQAGIYSEAWSDRTYAELLKRCEQHLWQGERVVIDANLRENHRRAPFFAAARRWGVPILFIHCTLAPEIARARLAARHHDASDANGRIYDRLRKTWEPLSSTWQRYLRTLDTSGPIDENVHRLQEILREEGLA